MAGTANTRKEFVDGFTPAHITLLRSLNTPAKIQNYLDNLPTNHEPHGDTCKSPLQVLHTGNAHCIEAAMLAAVILQLHGKKPLLVDLTADKSDQDHVLAVYKEGAYWGAIAKSNHHALGYRDPVYRSVRELVMSYAHEYLNLAGKKSLRSYAGPLDLRTFGQEWITRDGNVWEIPEALVRLPHKNLFTPSQVRKLRSADAFQRTMSNVKRDKPETIQDVSFTRSEQ